MILFGWFRRRTLQRRWERWVVESEQILESWRAGFPAAPRPLPRVDEPQARAITETLLWALTCAQDDVARGG
ncbi:MAG TPA: hypothetical protein VF731_01775 [Solirubrobacterales bacterium]